MKTIKDYLKTSNLQTFIIDKDDNVLHNHIFVEVFYITNGAIQHLCNGKTQLFSKYTVCFLRPSDTHMFIRENNPVCTHRDILITINKFKSYCDNIDVNLFDFYIKNKEPFIFQLTPEEFNTYESIFTDFEKQPQANINSKLVLKENYIISTMVNLLAKILLVSKKGEDNPQVNLLIEKLSSPNNFYKSLNELINESKIFYERTYFSRIFKQQVGCSMVSYFISSKLRYSISLIKFTNLSIAEIALQSGFNNVTYFNKIFKDTYNVSPSEYRKAYKNNILSTIN